MLFGGRAAFKMRQNFLTGIIDIPSVLFNTMIGGGWVKLCILIPRLPSPFSDCWVFFVLFCLLHDWMF